MPTNSPATAPAAPQPTYIVPPQSVINRIKQLANAAAKSKAHDVNNAEHAFTVMMTGLELGVPPQQSLRDIRITKGKVSLSADFMAARVRALGLGTIELIEYTDECVTMKFTRADEPDRGVTLTWDTARVQQAGLAKKGSNHDCYPRQMKESRCTAEGVRLLFPEACGSIYTPDELGESFAFDQDNGDDADADAVDFADTTPDRFKKPADDAANKMTTVDSAPPTGAADGTTPGTTTPEAAPSPRREETTAAAAPQTPPIASSPAAASAPPANDRFRRKPTSAPTQGAPISAPVAEPDPTPAEADPTLRDNVGASITDAQVAAIYKLHAVLQTPAEEWKRMLADTFGVDTIKTLSVAQATDLIRTMLERCSSKDGAIRFGGLSDDELAALGITFPLGDKESNAPKASAAPRAAATSPSNSPTDSANASSTSTQNEAA